MELSLNNLILDVKIAIATVIDYSYINYPDINNIINCPKLLMRYNSLINFRMSDTPWFRMMMIDDEFCEFAKSDKGIKWFLGTYTKILYGDNGEYISYLFGNIHSFTNLNSQVLPAVSFTDRKEYYYYGNRHSYDDEPAVSYLGKQVWYSNGLKHRDDDKPAYRSFITKYYKNGLLHRDGDIPAVYDEFGSKYWYRNGMLHRDKGYAEKIVAVGGMTRCRRYIDGVIQR